MRDKIQEFLASTPAGFAVNLTGASVGAWMQENWLSILSAIGIVVTIWMQIRQDRRQARRLISEARKVTKKASELIDEIRD